MIPTDDSMGAWHQEINKQQNEHQDTPMNLGDGAPTATTKTLSTIIINSRRMNKDALQVATLKPRHRNASRTNATGRLKPWKADQNRIASKATVGRRHVSFSSPVTAVETVSKTENRNYRHGDPIYRKSVAMRYGGHQAVSPLITTETASLPANSVKRESDRAIQVLLLQQDTHAQRGKPIKTRKAPPTRIPPPIVKSTVEWAKCDIAKSVLVASYPAVSTSDLDMADVYQPLSLYSHNATAYFPDDTLLQDFLLMDQGETNLKDERKPMAAIESSVALYESVFPSHRESSTETINVDEDDRKPAAKSIGFSTAAAAVAMDLKLAISLQQEESEGVRAEENLMYTSATGKAWKFVEQVMELHKGLSCSMVAPIAFDDLVFTAERLLLTQGEFQAADKSTVVDLGYHYTDSSNLASIRADGLMNKKEQGTHCVNATRFRGSAYGSGIYSATNPSAYNGKYGDMGLLVARLRGNEADHPYGGTRFNKGNDSLIVNRGHLNEFMVLPGSRQCIPILQFEASCIVRSDPDSPGNAAIFYHHLRLQQIIDKVFNGGVHTAISPHARCPSIANNSTVVTSRPFIIPDSDSRPTSHPAYALSNTTSVSRTTFQQQLERQQRYQHAVRKEQIPRQRHPSEFHFMAPEILGAAIHKCFRKVTQAQHSTLANECLICLDPLMRGKIVSIDPCNHMFHQHCIVEALGHNRECPCCRTAVGNPQGQMPSGSMSITRSSISCSGFEHTGTICILYTIPKGMQKVYHSNPGQSHGSANRCAYLPDTVDGTNLLKRLTYAFQHGLTFSVGVSMSSGRDNSVVWALPHKTSTKSSSHGFPDPNYFDHCNKELDALRVPTANLVH